MLQVRSLLTFLNFPVDEQRLDCLAGGRRETFHRLVGQEEVVDIRSFWWWFVEK